MLRKREEELLKKELIKAKKINQRINGTLLPEEKALFDLEYPSGGLHNHDENNPFGMHRHFLGDTIDGAHTHTPQNPHGEHVHGEFIGSALIDGSHSHNSFGGGYHHHEEVDQNTIIPKSPKGEITI